MSSTAKDKKAFAGGFGSMGHLAWRFATSLDPRGPSAEDDAWAKTSLNSGEQDLWERMSGPDRRHAVMVARDSAKFLGEDPAPRQVYEAALMHDVGKVESGLGTFSRVAVTFLTMVVGSSRVRNWYLSSESLPGEVAATGLRRRCGAYVSHDVIGADLLSRAQAGEMAVTWARQHHSPESTWTVDDRTAQALKAADGD